MDCPFVPLISGLQSRDDDTAKMATDAVRKNATDGVQVALNNNSRWRGSCSRLIQTTPKEYRPTIVHRWYV